MYWLIGQAVYSGKDNPVHLDLNNPDERNFLADYIGAILNYWRTQGAPAPDWMSKPKRRREELSSHLERLQPEIQAEGRRINVGAWVLKDVSAANRIRERTLVVALARTGAANGIVIPIANAVGMTDAGEAIAELVGQFRLSAGAEERGTPEAGRAALRTFLEGARGTIEALAPWNPTEPVTNLADRFPRLAEAAQSAGYERGIAQSVWINRLPAGPLLKSRNVFVQKGVSWNKANEVQGRLAGYVTFVDSPELADVIIGEDRLEVAVARHQAFVQVNDGTAQALTPGLLKYLEEWGLLDPGAVVVLDLLLLRQGDQGEDLVLFA